MQDVFLLLLWTRVLSKAYRYYWLEKLPLRPIGSVPLCATVLNSEIYYEKYLKIER